MLLGLTPWEPKDSVPRLAPPAPEARVGNAVAVPGVGPAVAVVRAAVGPGKAELVSGSTVRPNEGDGRQGRHPAGPALAVAVPVAKQSGDQPEAAPPAETAPPSEAPPAAATPEPELAAAPITPPSTPSVGKTPGGPVAAGSPGSPGEAEEEAGEGQEEPSEGEEEACAGDEYTLTITPPGAEGESVAIVLEHLGADGSVETLDLEGDLEDARSLVLQLTAEGSCVAVEVVPPSPAAT